MPSFGGSVAKKRSVAPAEQEMVSLLDGGDKKGKAAKPATGRQGFGFGAVTRMIPSMGATKASDVKKRGKGTGDEEKVSLLDSDGKPTGTPDDRKKKSAPPIPWTRDRIIRYLGLMVGAAIFTYVLFNRPRDVHWDKLKKQLEPSAKGDKRCFFNNKNEKQRVGEVCDCPEPYISAAKTGALADQWQRHHNDMVKVAKGSSEELDIVFLGDSFIERLGGTDGMGTQVVPGHKKAFDMRFSRRGGGRMDGKAFGTAADTGPNLLWHLENGLLEPLNPKIWFIMIGANDLFTQHCNDDFVIASVLNVAKMLSLQYPESLFVIHGIMPRKDNPKAPTNVLGKTWKRAQDINAKLRKFCKRYRNFYYMQAGGLMLAGSTTRGRAQLNSEMMMPDGIHPTQKGFEKWADFVVDRLTDVLKDFEEFKAKLKKGK